MPIDTINVELMLAGWSQTHSGGAKVTFWINDEDLEQFKHLTVRKGNTAGQRFIAALAEIGDDEHPKDRDKSRTPLMTSAVMLCNEEQFQRFCHERETYPTGTPPEQHAKQVILKFCDITTRKDLDVNHEAAGKFRRLMTIYREWLDNNT